MEVGSGRKALRTPHSLIICYDWYPKPARQRHPLLLNENIAELTEQGRRLCNRMQPFWRRLDPLWSAYNEREAFDLLATADADLMQRCCDWSHKRKDRLRSAHQVLDVLSEGRRSRTDLIRYGAGQAVQKTFRLEFERLCQNEVTARQLFAAQVAMPALDDYSSARVIMEYLPGLQFLQPQSLSRAEKLRTAETLVWMGPCLLEQGLLPCRLCPEELPCRGRRWNSHD